MRADDEPRAPLLVLGVGNLLLRDDGVGLALLEELGAESVRGVEFVDGGTQGIALGALVAGRRALLVLDAIQLGAAPGTVHRIDDPLRHRPPRADSAHGANAGDLLATCALLGDLPEHVTMVGVEPAVVRTGVGLSDAVRVALPHAVAAARGALDDLRGRLREEAPCTS